MTEKRSIDYDCTYMRMAICMSNLSYAIRNKVGAIIVSKNGQIISQGFNGTPTGFDNCCETAECTCKDHSSLAPWDACTVLNKCFDNPSYDKCGNCIHLKLTTKPVVLHAESNAIAKCAKWLNTTEDSTIYVSLSPCFDCSKLIIQAGIKRVVFHELYRNTNGLENLKQAGIIVQQIDLENKTLKTW